MLDMLGMLDATGATRALDALDICPQILNPPRRTKGGPAVTAPRLTTLVQGGG
jgi:hypothetical protein